MCLPQGAEHATSKGYSMPPRQSGNKSNSRRRPVTVMPGGWLGLMLLLMVVVVLFFAFNEGVRIEYSEFRDLVDEGKVQNVVFQGNERIKGEITDPDKLPEELRKRFSKTKNKF